MAAPYSTATYPYPSAMWDEAAEHLAQERGWGTLLLVCPNPTEVEATGRQELAARNFPSVTVLVTRESFSRTHWIRISPLTHINPRWDDVEDHLTSHSTVALLVVDPMSEGRNAQDIIIEAKAAMAERGFNVSVGYSSDPDALEGLLRIEKV